MTQAHHVITDLTLQGEDLAAQDVILRLTGVTCSRRKASPTVDNLHLTVLRGETTVLLGRPRSGRSTILHLMHRDIEPEAGEVLFDGESLRKLRRKAVNRRIGHLPAGGGLPPTRTVGETLTAILRRHGWKSADADARIIEMFALLEIPGTVAERQVNELAPWLRRAVGLAAVTAPDPDVLLLDEPFAISDRSRRAGLHRMLERLQSDRRRTIVLATDDGDEAFRFGDRVAVVERPGRIVQYGRPREIVDAPTTGQVADLVGDSRGWRVLSLLSASVLSPQRILAVRSPAAVPADQTGIVLDGQAAPRGWVLPERRGVVFSVGTTFDPARDSLQTALDAALASPTGQAVAADRETGRYLGVVPIGQIIHQTVAARRSSVVSIHDEIGARAERLDRREKAAAAERARRIEAEQSRMLAEISPDTG